MRPIAFVLPAVFLAFAGGSSEATAAEAIPVAVAARPAPADALKRAGEVLAAPGGHRFQFQLQAGAADPDTGRIFNMDAYKTYGGRVAGGIHALEGGTIFFGPRSGAIRDDDRDRWARLSAVPEGREVEKLLRPVDEVLSLAIRGARNGEWAGDDRPTILVPASKSQVNDYFSSLTSSGCAGGT